MSRSTRLSALVATLAVIAGCTAILGIDEPTGGGADAGPADAAPGESDAALPFSVAFEEAQPHAVRGGQVFRTVRVTRDAGFTGAINVTLLDLPPQVSSTPLTIPAGSDSGQIQLDTMASATLGPVAVRLVGEAGGPEVEFPASIMIADRPGTLDESFGTAGKVTVPALGMFARDVAVQPDGRILVVGDGAQLVRLLEDGTPDPEFGGGDGIVTAGDDGLNSVSLLADGKLLTAGGRFDPGPGTVAANVRRWNADGTPDTGYGNAGAAEFAGHIPHNMVSDGFGNALVAGSNMVATFRVARFTTAGVLDGNFAGGGQFTADPMASVNGIAARADLSFVTIGGISTFDKQGVYVVSLDNGGIPQIGFGDGGVVAFGADGDTARAAAFDAAGNVVVAGNTNPTGMVADRRVLAGRLLAGDGAPDPAFGGGDGLIDLVFGLPGAEARDLAVQNDGKIVLATVGNQGGVMPARQGGVMRLNQAGGLDVGFDVDGAVLLNDGGGTPMDSIEIYAVALMPDGRIVIVGGQSMVPGYLVVRIWD